MLRNQCTRILKNRTITTYTHTPSNIYLQNYQQLPILFTTGSVRWASKAARGSSDNGRDSNPKFLGIKKQHGQYVFAGNILVRQRGTKFHPGDNVGLGKDHTLFAKKSGIVQFKPHPLPYKRPRKCVHIKPLEYDLLEWWKEEKKLNPPVGYRGYLHQQDRALGE